VRGRLALLAVLVVAAGTGLLGIDFGHHWDETERIATAILAVERGELISGWYQYPSAVHDLILLSAAPDVARHSVIPALNGDEPTLPAFRLALQEPAFLLRVRGLFLILSVLGAVPLYAMVRRWRASAFEAVTAAGLFSLSWEIAYHARWVAPDVLTASAAAAVLWAVQRSLGDRRTRWLAAAGAAAGVATSAKYPSGLLLLPVLAAIAHAVARRRARIGVAIGAAFGPFVAAYLIITPGTVLQYRQFLWDVRVEIAHYHTGHGGHTIAAGWPHLRAELEYLGLVAFSHHPPIAGLFFALALIGAAWVVRRDRWMALVLLPFVVAYPAYLGSQRVMLVRNLLVVVPFLAVLAARGAGVGRAAAARLRWGSTAVTAAVGALLSVNAVWLVDACRSIRGGDPERELLDALSRPGASPCVVTPSLRAALSKKAPRLPASIVPAGSEGARWIAFRASEVRKRAAWVANRRDTTIRWFGPHEVNFDYYPTWAGRDRILLMRLEDAAPLDVPLQ
jgi:Dolichyl-phosphate-mannose-protein mannosyltransferase